MKETNEIEKLRKTINSIDTAMKTILTVGGIFLGIFAFLFSGMVLVFFTERPDKPEIKYGEFPFTITCELNGKEYTVEDVVICEYAGTKSTGSMKLGRSWKSYLQSDAERKENVILLRIEDGDTVYELSAYFGDAAHYMGDYENQSRYYSKSILYDCERVTLSQWENGERIKWEKITMEESMERFGFRVIEKQFASPIQNTFR